MKPVLVLSMILAVSCMSPAVVLLNDTWADASRSETNLPNESAVWAGTPASVTMGVGSLAYAQGTASQKLWTYFAPNGSPVVLDVGEKLIATITFSPEGALHDGTSRNFRFGLFNDPTNDQLWSDTNSDSGGDGRWTDSTGYAVQFGIGDASAPTAQVGKRTDQTNSSLLGSGSAYTWGSSGGNATGCSVGTVYTMTLTLDYQAANLMQVDFAFTDGAAVNIAASLTDNGLGGDPVWTNFDQLFFRFSNTTNTADVINFHSFTIEHVVPEPATLALLGLGGLLSIRRHR